MAGHSLDIAMCETLLFAVLEARDDLLQQILHPLLVPARVVTMRDVAAEIAVGAVHYNDEVTRQEIIFLVTPTVIKEEVMTAASDEADNLVRNVQVGVREGLLPWSREKIASNLNHDAHVALGNGETNRAISYINRSLRNDPNQPEMVNMRYQLLGERSIYSTGRDVLDQIFERTFRRSVGETDEQSVFPTSDPLSSAAPGSRGSDLNEFDPGQFTGGDPFAVTTAAAARIVLRH